MRRTMRVLELFAERRESRRVLVVTINVAQQADQLFESRRIDAAVFLQAIVRPRPKLIQIPSCFGYANHGYIKMSALHHRLQRRENFLVGQITGCTEEDQSVGMRIAHTLFLPSLALSEWLVVAFILVTPWFAFWGWIGFVWLDVTAFLRKRNFSRRRLFPQAKSTKKCVSIISCAATCGQFFKLPDVTSAEHHVVRFEGRNQALHGIGEIYRHFFLPCFSNPRIPT